MSAAFSGANILLFGATGTIGRAVLYQLLADGHAVTCAIRPAPAPAPELPERVRLRPTRLDSGETVLRDAIDGEPFDAIISCLASRTGAPTDAWVIDHRAHLAILEAAEAAGIPQFVQLSAICVQKPRLAFQQAKLAFEDRLMSSGLTWSIVRPTAYFKSLSGQVERVRSGKPFLVFGDGRLTACKPISDRDLAAYVTGCLTDPDRQNRILPIGGPGPAITPRDQGAHLFKALGTPERFSAMPVAAMRAIAGTLVAASTLIPPLKARAEFARTGLYYGTESMLVWDQAAGRYDADATPETGADTLFDHYDALLSGTASHARSAHSVF